MLILGLLTNMLYKRKWEREAEQIRCHAFLSAFIGLISELIFEQNFTKRHFGTYISITLTDFLVLHVQ